VPKSFSFNKKTFSFFGKNQDSSSLAVAFFLNRCSLQVAFFFFLIKKRNKKNQGRKDTSASLSTSPFCQAALMNFCTTVASTFDLYSLIRCGLLNNEGP